MNIEGPTQSELEKRKENIHQGVEKLRTRLDEILGKLDSTDDVEEVFITEQRVDKANWELSSIENDIGVHQSRRKLGLS